MFKALQTLNEQLALHDNASVHDDQKQIAKPFPPFVRFATCDFWFVSELNIAIIFWCFWDLKAYDQNIEEHSGKRVPEMPEQWQRCEYANKVFISLFREFDCQTLYNDSTWR